MRPFVDLTRPGGVETMAAVADEISALVAEYDGVNASEHGDGRVRSPFNPRVFGDDLYEAFREVKALFDPDNRLNPGVMVDAAPITVGLRDPALPPAPPLRTHFAFEGGMRTAADRCQRIGACRKTGEGVMCPSYMATREEEHATRGRANALVKALSEPDPRAALGDERLHEILDLCLECKACKSECPLSVDMATMKAEFLSHYQAQHGIPLRSRLFGAIRRLNRLGAATAPVSNLPLPRALLERATGIDRRRPLPRFTRDTLLRWDRGRARPRGARGDVVFLADSFTTFTEPAIGRAAIELLELAGWNVRLESAGCCGRSSISKGLLGQARGMAEAMVRAARAGGRARRADRRLRAVVPADAARGASRPAGRRPAGARRWPRRRGWWRSCWSRRSTTARSRCGPAPTWPAARSSSTATATRRRWPAPPPRSRCSSASPAPQVTELDAGCCGMAGSFGFEAEHYDLSMQIGEQRLFPALRDAAPGTLVAATGVSCRQQIGHGVGQRAWHPVELVRSCV